MCVSYQPGKKKKNLLKSNPLNYRTLERDPRASLPLANQSQYTAAVNISDSTDLNKDIMIISLSHSSLE